MKKLVILTGAGMSAESGISTFRDNGGLWEQYKIEDVATPEGFNANPKLVLDFYNQRRRQLFQVEPNKGHIGLADLQKLFDVRIITQNVDNLHERAGNTSIIHLHGELLKVRSSKDPDLIYELTADKPDIQLGDLCEKGSQLRPHIVWFGEAVPMIDPAIKWAEEADIFVVIGTSLNVYPAAGLLSYVKKGKPIFLIDPNEVRTNRNDITFIQKSASEGVEELSKILQAYV
ncbi:MAG: SIR2 family NAD-dependent protein deacylase [Tannerellaceae bacterium]